MLPLLRTFSWQELRHHPWRTAAAVVAVMLGVALAFSVHLINASALSEFDSATRSVSGQPDLSLRATSGGLNEQLFGEVARHPLVSWATPVLEVQTATQAVNGDRVPLRVLGVDALSIGLVAPGLLPVPSVRPTLPEGVDDSDGSAPQNPKLDVFAPDALFLNARAQAALLGQNTLRLQNGMRQVEVRVAGTVSGGDGSSTALAVMDIGAAQELFDELGHLTRIDLRLQPGADTQALLRDLRQLPDFGPQVMATEPQDAQQRVHALSRAYRVNLTVLALVALFTGGFLVFSVLSLSIAKRTQQFALLGVLGLTPQQRMRLVLVESVLLGVVGSAAGLGLGTALAKGALTLLGGDLGGGYFPGLTPRLQWDAWAAVVYGLLGVLAALLGGWWPARTAQRLPPAQALKGLGWASTTARRRWPAGVVLIALGAVLSAAPPVFGLPLAAYASVGLILFGGVAALPSGIALLYDAIHPLLSRRLLPLLAVERARRQRETAAVAISGVVASLSLAVALTVMVTSFRGSVMTWLDALLPAHLYVRMGGGAAGTNQVLFDAKFVQSVSLLPTVQRAAPQRVVTLLVDPARPPVTLIARQLGDGPGDLPFVGEPIRPPNASTAITTYVSEAFADLYRVKPGDIFTPTRAGDALAADPAASLSGQRYFVAGVWRDYARQHGTLAIDAKDYVRVTRDHHANDIALWLHEGADVESTQERIRVLADAASPGLAKALEFASSAQIRANSLNVFDRTFAVTYWLQAVAIGIGLFGVAASFSAQVLARRKEFGLLVHLGLTRRQILTLVALEGLVWTVIGAIAGVILGLTVAVVLVDVVNPQSFHWTMDLAVPTARLALLCAALIAAGTLTAWLAGRAAARREAVLAVKEDW